MSSPSDTPDDSSALRAAARVIRMEMGRHDFSEPQLRLMDKILLYSLEVLPLGRPLAVIPRQVFLAQMCRLREPKVSEELGLLSKASVIERKTVVVDIGRRKCRWDAYSVNPPTHWVVELRVKESAMLRDLEAWLCGLDLSQAELIAPPPSLSELLRADFVERAGEQVAGDTSRVEGQPITIVMAHNSSPGGNSVTVESSKRLPCGGSSVKEKAVEVLPGGSFGEKVPCGGSFARASIDPDRLIESKKVLSRSGSIDREPEVPCGGSDYQAYVEKRLFTAIGLHERNGRSADRWRKALERVPERLDELISFGLEQKRLGRLRGPLAAWLNTSAENALSEENNRLNS